MPCRSRLKNGPGDGIGEAEILRKGLALLVGWTIPRFEKFLEITKGDLHHWWSLADPGIEKMDFLTGHQRKQLGEIYEEGPERLLESVDSWSGQIIVYDEDRYPAGFREMGRPPVAVHILGSVEALSHQGIAVVGSRKIGVGAAKSARRILQPALAAGMAVISGGALGADAVGHRSAVDLNGVTIAVLPSGLHQPSPRSNRQLFRDIIEGRGALVSEYPPMQGVRNYHFRRRNGLIAALSRGVFVIRAAQKSGTMLTVEAARELGRPLAAMPGLPDDPISRGCHDLVRDGAELIASDGNLLQWWERLNDKAVVDGRPGAPEQQQILRPTCEVLDSAAQVLDEEGTFSLEAVARRTGKSAAHLQSVLLTHELSGIIEHVAGGERYRMII